ncbi:ribonuclease H-like domain-containing protein [Tanacetum coccineum]
MKFKEFLDVLIMKRCSAAFRDELSRSTHDRMDTPWIQELMKKLKGLLKKIVCTFLVCSLSRIVSDDRVKVDLGSTEGFVAIEEDKRGYPTHAIDLAIKKAYNEPEVAKGFKLFGDISYDDVCFGRNLQEDLFTHKEEMDLETAQINTTIKLPLLKQGEYDMWKLRIEQYFQVQDYALWDVIENGNSFKPAAQTTTNADGSSPGPVTVDEKTQKKNDVKARSMLLMALPNEHLLTFNQYKDAKTLFAAIQTRFGGNDATKKTYKTLLKQMYENFIAPRIESLDSIFNRLQKIIKVKGTTSSSSSSSSQNLAFMSSTSSTNKVNTAYGVSTTTTQVSTASTQVSTANISDDTVYAFWSSQPNGSHLIHEDLEQIHKDDLEEVDLKWQLALLSMRTRKECRGPRNQDNMSRNQDNSRRTINVEEISSKAMLAIDGAGFEWSFMADEEDPTNMALMDFSDSEFNKSEFNLATYKRGLTSIEEQLVFYKKNEVIFCEQLAVIKRDISYKDSEISVLKSELEKLKQEKESNQLKIEKFDNASKSLDKLIGSQIPDKSRKGLGFVSYNAVPPPHTGLFSPPTLDLSYSGLEEFQQPKFEGYGPKSIKSVSEDISNEGRESHGVSLVEELVSNDKLEKKTIFPTITKINFVRPQQQEKPVRKSVKYAEMYRLTAITIKGKGWDIVPRAVLMKTGLRPLNIARPINTAHPKTTVYSARPIAKGKVNTARVKAVNTVRPNTAVVNAVRANQVNVVKASTYFKELDGGYVTFGGGAKGGRITGKGTLKTGKLDFKDVYFVKELQFNIFSVSQMCDKNNSVLFTDTACFVLSPDFKLTDESQVLLKVPRKNNMYSVDMKNIVPKDTLIYLVAKATLDESMLWHRRLGHVNFKTINKLVKDNLVKGLPIKRFENDQTCVACLKGKQHKASSRTPQQNGVAERRNRTLIEAARTMLADSKLPTTFWAEAVNTACYVQNRVLVVKPHNKTPYELFRGRTPSLSFMRPFGCHVTILNTLDHLGKFDGKSDDGFFVGYSLNSKAFRVYNIRTRKVEENLHVRFLEDKPIIAGDGPKWLFDIDVLTKSMNYMPVLAGTTSNDFVGRKESIGAGHSSKELRSSQDYILMPLWKDGSLFDYSLKVTSNDEPQPSNDVEKKDDKGRIDDQERTENSAQDVNTTGPSINTASTNFNTVIETRPLEYPDRNDTAICLELVSGWSFQSFSNRISNSVSI